MKEQVTAPEESPEDKAARRQARDLWQTSQRADFIAQVRKALATKNDYANIKDAVYKVESTLTLKFGKPTFDLICAVFRTGSRLSATVIDEYINALFVGLLPRPNLLVCRVATVTQLLAGRLNLPVEIVEGFTVVAPCHHADHWSLMIATLVAKKDAQCAFRVDVQTYDSMASPDLERPEHVTLAKAIRGQFVREASPDLSISWMMEGTITQQVQQSSVNCGVYVLWWLRALVSRSIPVRF